MIGNTLFCRNWSPLRNWSPRSNFVGGTNFCKTTSLFFISIQIVFNRCFEDEKLKNRIPKSKSLVHTTHTCKFSNIMYKGVVRTPSTEKNFLFNFCHFIITVKVLKYFRKVFQRERMIWYVGSLVLIY